jgi:hypothetical protein
VIKEAYQWRPRSQRVFPPLTGHVSLTIRYYLKKKIDLDNTQKLLLECVFGQRVSG